MPTRPRYAALSGSSGFFRYAARAGLAVAAGLALWVSFPGPNWWWAAPFGVWALAAVSWRRGFRSGFGFGMLAGWACFGPTLSWSGTYVGVLPWLALATLQGLYLASMSALVGWGSARLLGPAVTREATGERAAYTTKCSPGRGRSVAAHALVPLGWVAQELARSTTPWGGFPWARLAFGQADGPLVTLARWGGAPGVSFAVALIGVALMAAAHGVRRRARVSTVCAIGVVAVVIGTALLIRPPVDGSTATVGFVQGNVPTAGLEFNAQRRAVLDNHVAGTVRLAAEKPAGLSLVVWPENSSDIDPFRNTDAAAQIGRAVNAIDVPLLVGAVLAEPPGHDSNVSLLYRPDGGEPERYVKRHPAPFAEYIPYRGFFSRFSDAARLAGNFVAGDTIGAFRIDTPQEQSYWALPTICFEVAYDDLVRESVLNTRVNAGTDSALLIVQTNNATFGYTDESEQQFAISRLRAIEHGRSIVHVSTVGVSGMIRPDGSVLAKTGLFTAEQAVVHPVLRTEVTPSDRLGPWPERLAVGVWGALLGLGAARHSRPTSRRR